MRRSGLTVPTAFIQSAAFWAPALPGWPLARAAFRGAATVPAAPFVDPLPVAPFIDPLPAAPFAGQSPAAPLGRPSPALLAPAERRRAPDTVALALEVAAHAVADAGVAPAGLLSVFTSAHGDLAITDAMCSALATQPTLVSPTKFLNSVHNAASGYWGIATGCGSASTAVSAAEFSFAAGLLEALSLCAAEAQPVLLVGYDVAARGALVSTNASRGLLAVALVLAPQRSAHSLGALGWSIRAGPAAREPLRSDAARALAANGMADALPFFEALARDADAAFSLPLGATLALQLRLEPGTPRAEAAPARTPVPRASILRP